MNILVSKDMVLMEKCAQDFNRYQLINVIGKGTYGTVWQSRDLMTQMDVAIKILTYDEKCEDKKKSRIHHEISIQQELQHENILAIRNVIVSTNQVWIITDLLEFDLYQLLYSHGNYTCKDITKIMYQVLLALEHLHERSIVHRDLKPGNILLNNKFDIKICDFGLSKKIDELKKSEISDYVATRWFRPPELVLAKGQCTTSIDIWSFGCCYAEALCRKPLFPGKDHFEQINLIINLLGHPKQDYLKKYAVEEALKFVSSIPRKQPLTVQNALPPQTEPGAVEVIENCLKYEPESRASAKRLLMSGIFMEYHSTLQQYQLKSKATSTLEVKRSARLASNNLLMVETTPTKPLDDSVSTLTSPWSRVQWSTSIQSACEPAPATLE